MILSFSLNRVLQCSPREIGEADISWSKSVSTLSDESHRFFENKIMPDY
jgi:hypothetical protein